MKNAIKKIVNANATKIAIAKIATKKIVIAVKIVNVKNLKTGLKTSLEEIKSNVTVKMINL